MERTTNPKPEIGRLVPGFGLIDTAGRVVSPWDFKERKNLVIVFFDPGSEMDLGLLAELKRRYAEFQEENAEVLAIGRGSGEDIGERGADLDLPYVVLADPAGQTHDAYAVTETALFVADRFGELVLRTGASESLDALLGAVVTRLGLIELECPECGVPTWD